MKIRVRGHYKRIKIGERIAVDDSNVSNEATVPIYVEVWIDPYDREMTPRKRGNDGRFKRSS